MNAGCNEVHGINLELCFQHASGSAQGLEQVCTSDDFGALPDDTSHVKAVISDATVLSYIMNDGIYLQSCSNYLAAPAILSRESRACSFHLFAFQYFYNSS